MICNWDQGCLLLILQNWLDWTVHESFSFVCLANRMWKTDLCIELDSPSCCSSCSTGSGSYEDVTSGQGRDNQGSNAGGYGNMVSAYI